MLGTKWTSMLRTGGITDGVRLKKRLRLPSVSANAADPCLTPFALPQVYAIDEDTLVVQLQDASETLLAVKKFLYSDDNVESLECAIRTVFPFSRPLPSR